MAYTKNAAVDAMDTDKQLAYYKANPEEAKQEIARAQGVGGAAASNWVNQLQGVQTPKPAISAATAPSTIKPTTPNLTPNTSPTQQPSAQQSAQDWINNAASGQGGMESYVKNQQAKYDYATRTGDKEMLTNLSNDMQRVGYKLNQTNTGGGSGEQAVNAGTYKVGDVVNGWTLQEGGGWSGNIHTVTGPAPGTTGIPGMASFGAGAGAGAGAGVGGKPALNLGGDDDAIGKEIMNGVNQKIQSINQGLGLSQQANNDQVNQNQNFLNEQIAKMTKQKASDLDSAVTFQNRRGGFYSGGLDYQQGQINSGYEESVGGLNRDIASRNDAIWKNNTSLAKNAADNIAMLLQQAPDQIRAAVSAAASKQHDNDIEMAKLTGNFQDTSKVDAVKQKMAQNSADYALASPSRQKELHDENIRLAASIGGSDTTGNGDYAFSPGTRTMEGQQQDYNQYKDDRDFQYTQYRDAIKDQQYQQKFDQDAQQFGIDYALKQAVQLGQLDISQMNADTSRMNANTSANNASVTNNRYTDQQNARGFEGTVMDEISQLDPSDYEGWLNKNRGEIVRQLGTDGFDKIKKSVTAPAQQAGKSADSLRTQAINLAKNDPNWYNEADREGLIQEYMGYLR